MSEVKKAINEMKKRPFSDLNEEEYKKRYKKLKTFLKTGDLEVVDSDVEEAKKRKNENY